MGRQLKYKNLLTSVEPQIFVLWGENFDGNMATAFVTKFRSVGLKVRIVGLRGKQVTGIHGIALVPDMPLSQALPLAERVSCVVIPCHSPYLCQIDNDPRVQEFFQRTNKNQADFVTGQVRLSDVDRFMDLDRVMRCLEYAEIDQSVNTIKEKLL